MANLIATHLTHRVEQTQQCLVGRFAIDRMNSISIEFWDKRSVGKELNGWLFAPQRVCQVRRGEIVDVQARVLHGGEPYGCFACCFFHPTLAIDL